MYRCIPKNKQRINHGQQPRFLATEAHIPIIPTEIFEKVQEEIKRRSNIEVVNENAQRKATHYSAKALMCSLNYNTFSVQ